jgi:hypothetical protein
MALAACVTPSVGDGRISIVSLAKSNPTRPSRSILVAEVWCGAVREPVASWTKWL